MFIDSLVFMLVEFYYLLCMFCNYTVSPLTDRSTMHHEDQSLQKQKIHAEDVAYAAFLDTVLDVGEELEQYDECVVLSGDKLQTTLDEIDVLKYCVDTAYKVLLDAALSPLSSRLRRCKSNLETRIADLKIDLTSNAAQTTTAQRELCEKSEPDYQTECQSSEMVTTECDENDTVQTDGDTVHADDDTILTDDACVQSNSTDNDCMQICYKYLYLIDDMAVVPDDDRQIEKDSVPGTTTEDALQTDLNMTKLEISNCDADTHDHICEFHAISGLKHRWRWKLV